MSDARDEFMPRPIDLLDGRLGAMFGDPTRYVDAPRGVSAAATCVLAVARSYDLPAPPLADELTWADLQDALRCAGLAAAVERGQSLEDLALFVEHGSAVVALANAGLAWGEASAVDHGQPNHPLLIPAVARLKKGGDLAGAYAWDPAVAKTVFLSADRLEQCWLRPGGLLLIVSDDEPASIYDSM